MAYQPTLQMSIQDKSGQYYGADLNPDATWNITTTFERRFIEVMPEGWSDTAITWERDLSVLGVFRSMTSGSYKFTMDGREILKKVWQLQGIKGYAKLTIWMINTNDFDYSIFYPSQIDFKTYHDYEQTQTLEIGTLDSGLIRDWHARGDNDINIPLWRLESGGWVTDAAFLMHDGIKLLYNATYISGATLDVPWIPGLITGFNHGRHATSGVNQGKHTLPSLSQYNIVQNNGTTTYIGNDILANLLLQGNQHSGGANIINEINFGGSGESQPYNTNNFSLKNACLPPNVFTMSVACSGRLNIPDIAFSDNGNGCFLGFVLFEIHQASEAEAALFGVPVGYDLPEYDPITLRYQYQMVYSIDILAGTVSPYTIPDQNFSNYDSPATVTINPNRAYVFGIIFDEGSAFGGISGDGAHTISTGFTSLQFSFISNYDYGASGVPISAPQLNPTAFTAYRLHQLFNKLVPYLATRQTDSYGFPVPVTTDYYGVSDFLSNPAVTAIGDVVPYQILLSSAYCIHDLQGRSYITLSLNKLVDFCRKVLGCAMGVEYDVNGVGVGLRIEDYSYYFPDSTNPANMILDLGSDVTAFEILQGGSEMGIAANLKLGYQKADTNTDFGVDPFNTGLYFQTPVPEIVGTIDFEEDSILTEQYAIEKIRQQRVNQPIGSTFDPASPSSDNSAVAFYCLPYPTTWIGTPTSPNPTYPNTYIFDPANNVVGVGTPATPEAYQLTQRNGINLPAAQSTDSSAATNPYIKGMYYPDTAYNVELSPCRALERGTGQLIHSLFDKMDSEYLTFRNTYVMQYNNETLALAGIESNLNIGSGTAGVITEMSDKAIVNLPDKLFQPVQLKVTSKYPVNMYSILNSNTRGYVRFFWEEQGYGMNEYKFYITKVTQAAGNNSPTIFEGWATPDTII